MVGVKTLIMELYKGSDAAEVLEYWNAKGIEKKSFRSKESFFNYIGKILIKEIGKGRPEPYIGYWDARKKGLEQGASNRAQNVLVAIKLVTGKAKPAPNKEEWPEGGIDPLAELKALEEENYTPY